MAEGRLEPAGRSNDIFGELELLIDGARADSRGKCYLLRITMLEDLPKIVSLSICKSIKLSTPPPLGRITP